MTSLNTDIINNVKAELSRIEEDCIFSAKRHFNASSRWEKYHYWIGLPSALLACIERSEHHNSIGNQYLSLRNKTRLFRELGINQSSEEIVVKINELSSQRD